MNAAVSSPAFHAVPCGEETRSAKPRRSSSRHRSSDAGGIPREQCKLFNEERTPGKMQRQNMGYLL
ncbi:MAG: hypothetical protein ACLRWP_01510 [Bilophila wadsworthia]